MPPPDKRPVQSRPPKVRTRVIGFCFALAVITYMDRACIGVLATTMRADLSLSMVEMGYIFSAFTLAYAIFEIPSAWWGERIGTRRVLARIVAWWSAFTAITACALGFKSLWLVRFVFGAGEAGAWPNVTRVLSRWVPPSERGRSQGIFFSGAHLAAGLTPPLVLLIAQVLPWRAVFLIFGSLGFIWVIAWQRWFCDDPRDHPEVSAQELAEIHAGRHETSAGAPIGWRRLLGSRNVWLLCLVAFANSYGFYFVISWLPTYLSTLGFAHASLAFLSGLPMLLAVPADLSGGIVTDLLVRRLGLRWGRAVVGGCGYGVAAVAMFAATRSADTPLLAAGLLALAGGASMFALAASWACCIEIGAASSGLVSALMNTVGQVGGMLSPLVLAWLVERSQAAGKWLLPLEIIAGLYFLAMLSWCFIDASQRLDESPSSARASAPASSLA